MDGKFTVTAKQIQLLTYTIPYALLQVNNILVSLASTYSMMGRCCGLVALLVIVKVGVIWKGIGEGWVEFL
jgi:hypothetical protein